MIKILKEHKKLSVFCGFASLIAALVAWNLSSYLRGELAATVDVAQGHLRILEVGTPVYWRAVDTRLLRERYRIEARVVAGCLVSESLSAYTQGYNSVSEGAAIRKFGRDVFSKTEADAIESMRFRKTGNVPQEHGSYTALSR